MIQSSTFVLGGEMRRDGKKVKPATIKPQACNRHFGRPALWQQGELMSPDTHLIESNSLGQCWLRVSRLILDQGQPRRYDGAVTLEIAHLTLVIGIPTRKMR